MTSTSTSSTKWQVFVSFRGEDTRNNFTSHLEAALKRESIYVYTDNINLEKGVEISDALKEAIEGSKIAVVVLSENYASSSWCLRELSWIVDCRKRNSQIVFPIFYHVDPSDVRYQRGSFGDAFAENSKRRSADEVQSWRDALTQVANLSGYHIHQRSELKFIEKIAKDISTMLSFEFSNNFPHLVGIQSRVEQVKSLLHLESKEVVKIGIWGMGGIGKTTIAGVVFRQISDQFEGCCFLSNVRREFEKYGHISLRNKLLSKILGEVIDISTTSLPPVIQDRLQSRKVLIVLDDVKDPGQLDTLLCNCCFGRGSRILVTSRGKQVFQQVADHVYGVLGLSQGEALELFRLFAFKEKYPEDDFVGLSYCLVEYAEGVPLALKVLGSALKGKSLREWMGFLDKLIHTPNQDIQKILRISYNDLEKTQKDLFLDIACFFRGKNKDYVSEIYGGSSDYDIGILIDKSLVVVTEWNAVEMHDLLQEMGWDIFLQESVKEPGKRSRLWKYVDVSHVLKNNIGTGVIQGMTLEMLKMKEFLISPNAFERTNDLRLLNLLVAYQAAVKIQNVFRGYLARKVLRARKGLVKLQALVRGYLVRKQVTATPHSTQALIRAQTSVRSQRLRGLKTEIRARNSMKRFNETRSEHTASVHSRRLSASIDTSFNGIEESPKIVEEDTGRPKSRSICESESLKGKEMRLSSFSNLGRSGVSLLYTKDCMTYNENKQLPKSFRSSNNYQIKDLVGIQSRTEQVTSLLLHTESKEVVIVGIWGMGGIGKTTIVEAVFRQISAEFEGSHFIPNVRENFGKHDGIISLHNKVVSLILGEECRVITPVIQDKLQSTKVLIVLDDVNDPTHLDFLLSRCCFGEGSRIIITSRYRQVLQQVADEIYEVQGLTKGEGLELFSSFAFKARYPEDEFVASSHRLVECAQGVPLALKVLGSALKGKSAREWESFLDKLNETPNPKIQKILRIGYDDLNQTQKDLFLDIACFFRGKDEALLSEIYGASSNYDIGVLIDKSLIVVSDVEPKRLYVKFLDMHDLLQEMGRDIVSQESVRKPGKHSRLWKHEDVYRVLEKNTETEAVEEMFLDMSEMRELHITPTAFERINNLRLLNFYFVNDYSFLSHFRWDQKLYVTGDELCLLPDRLSYLRWDECPLKSLPLKFCAENLVHLIMPYSKLEKLWDGVQNLANLKRIILRGSKNLLEIPNLSQATNLEIMDLKDCISLSDLPNCTGLISLGALNLEGFFKITFAEISRCLNYMVKLKDLMLSCNRIEKIPESIKYLPALERLDLSYCERLQSIPELPISLKYLIANGCDSLASVSTPLSASVCVRRITFFDCLELDPSTLENEAQHIIVHRALEDVKLCKQGYIHNPSLIISYPGSGIPKWFSDPNRGSEITIKLPPLFYDNKFLGIAFVATVNRWLPFSNFGVNCRFISDSGDSYEFNVPLITSYEKLEGFVHHVVIGYSCCLYLELLHWREMLFVEASFSFSNDRKEIKIKKCGVCLLYTKDAEAEED